MPSVTRDVDRGVRLRRGDLQARVHVRPGVGPDAVCSPGTTAGMWTPFSRHHGSFLGWRTRLSGAFVTTAGAKGDTRQLQGSVHTHIYIYICIHIHIYISMLAFLAGVPPTFLDVFNCEKHDFQRRKDTASTMPWLDSSWCDVCQATCPLPTSIDLDVSGTPCTGSSHRGNMLGEDDHTSNPQPLGQDPVMQAGGVLQALCVFFPRLVHFYSMRHRNTKVRVPGAQR